MGKHGDGKPANSGKSDIDKTGKLGKHSGGNLHSDDTGDDGGATPGGASGGTG